MALFSRPVISIPLEIQMEVIRHCLNLHISPVTLMLVCDAWDAIVSREVYAAQVVHYLSSEKVERIISHFKKSESRPIFLCLAGLDWLFEEDVDWAHLLRLSVSVFPRVRSLGLCGNREVIQALIDTHAPALQVSLSTSPPPVSGFDELIAIGRPGAVYQVEDMLW